MKNKVQKIDYVLVFFLPLIIRIFGFIWNGRLRLIADEMGMLVPAASLAGRNWTGIAQLYDYYGFGYAMLLIPIFLLTKNPYVIYWSVMVTGAVLLSFSAMISYHILTKYFGIENRIYVIMVSTACSMLALTDMRYINNEPMLVLSCWVLLWLILLLVKHNNNNRQRIKYTILVILLLTYTLTVHSRLMVLWLAFALLVVLYYIFYKKALISLKIGIPLGICLFVAVLKVISFVQTCFWVADENGYLHNSIGSTSGGMVSRLVNLLQSTKSWNAVFNIAMGNIYTSIFCTAGIICFCGILLYKFLKAHFVQQDSFLEKIKPNKSVNKMIEVGSIFYGIVFFITLAGLMVHWGELAAKGQALGYGANTSATKIFVYIRYYSCYLSIVLLLFLRLFITIGIYGRDIWLTYGLSLLLSIATGFSALSLIFRAPVWDLLFLVYGGYTLNHGVTSINLYLICGALLSVLFAGVSACYKKGKIFAPIIFMLLMLVHRYWYLGAFLNETNDHKANAGYYFVERMETKVELPSVFYLRLVKTNCLAYQFFLNDYAMVQTEDFPIELESGIVITSVIKEQEQRYEAGFRCIYLDENEYMWVKGEDLQQQMLEKGVLFLEIQDLKKTE